MRPALPSRSWDPTACGYWSSRDRAGAVLRVSARVMERLGLGPDALLAANAKLVYGRMTGWGQDGPLATPCAPATTSTTSRCRARCTRSGAPAGPRCRRSTSSATSAAAACCWRRDRLRAVPRRAVPAGASGRTRRWSTARRSSRRCSGACRRRQVREVRGTNVLDSGAPWYDTYATKDQRYVAIGATRAQVLCGARRAPGSSPTRASRSARSRRLARAGRPRCASALAAVFATKTRDEWCRAFEGSDACFAPVLTFTEATRHPHLAARHAHVAVGAHHSARAGAALFAHARRRASRAARTRRARSRGAGRMGFRRRRDRTFACARNRASTTDGYAPGSVPHGRAARRFCRRIVVSAERPAVGRLLHGSGRSRHATGRAQPEYDPHEPKQRRLW